MSSIPSILATLRDALQQRYGDHFVRLVLYGSHARGQETEDSDIDVMVVLQARFTSSTKSKRWAI